MSVGKSTMAGKQLSAYIDRVERLRADQKQLGKDITIVYAEAKSAGFDTKVMKKVIGRREKKPHDLQEEDSMLDLYLHAIGMDKEAPLFSAVGRLSVDPTVRDQVQEADISAYGDVLLPSEAQEPILAKPVRDALTEWLEEFWAKDELQAVGVKPRMRAIFDGVPGVGKTTLAHHLAARIGLPLVAIRPDRIMTTYVSESARALGFLFDLARQLAADNQPHVLLFDEFDSLAQKRMHGGPNAVAEADHNNMVNVMLQRVEAHDGLIIAATNNGKEIDEAVWRRFSVHIRLQLPGQFERERIIERYIAPYVLGGEGLKRLAASLDTASPALIREFCEALKRNIIVGPRAGWNMQREAVVERIVQSIKPHPSLGLPALWSNGAKDIAVRWLEWPLQRAGGPKAEPEAA